MKCGFGHLPAEIRTWLLPWTAASPAFVNVCSGFDLPVNHRGFGAVGAGQRNPSGIWLLSLAARWLVMEASDYRWKSAWQEHCHFLHFSSAASHRWKGRALSPTKQVPAATGSALQDIHLFCQKCPDGQWGLRSNLGLVRSTTTDKLTNNRNLYRVLTNEFNYCFFETGISHTSYSYWTKVELPKDTPVPFAGDGPLLMQAMACRCHLVTWGEHETILVIQPLASSSRGELQLNWWVCWNLYFRNMHFTKRKAHFTKRKAYFTLKQIRRFWTFLMW